MPKLGFEFRETMSGAYTLTGQPGTERSIRFTLHAVAEDALAYARGATTPVSGTLEMDGFADEVAVAGSLLIAPLSQRVIRYELGFVANDGLPYKLVGQKDIRLSDLKGSLTTLPAEVFDAKGKPVAKAQVTFDLRTDLLKFLTSWKPLLPSRA